MKKKLLVIALAFAMMLAFAACGGGSDSEPAAEPSGAEPNTGCGAVVFAVPDGWTLTEATPGLYSRYDNPDSEYILIASVFNEETLASHNEWAESQGKEAAESIEAYYKSTTELSADELKERNLETSKVDVCGTEGSYSKWTGGKDAYYEVGTSWLYDGVMYQLFLYTEAAYDESGNLRDDAIALTDEDIAMFEGIVASVQPGDGTAYQKASMEESSRSVGSITYEVPEGYSVEDAGSDMVTFKKDGSETTLQVTCVTEETLGNYEIDGKTPSSLEEYYNEYLYEGIETATIAGFEGHIDKYPFEDGKYYNVSASFLADDGVYDIYMGSDAWDNNGELRADAEGLTEEDLAAFDAFIASMKKK